MKHLFLPSLALCLLALQGCTHAVRPAPVSPRQSAVAVDITAVPELRQERQGPSLKARIGRIFTGAVVGGWVGYFASHVAVSDWESGSGIGSYRGTWAAAGVALGAVTGRLLSGGGNSPDDLRPGLTAARQFIGRDEIVKSGAGNAYDLIRSLRKEWLVPRGVNSFRETARGSADFGAETVVVPGADHILVYLDNARLGGTQHLVDIGVELIGRVEFITPSEATFRWGTGHAHGVILITSMGAETSR